MTLLSSWKLLKRWLSIIAKALGDIARAKGMTEIESATGLSRERL